jgi:hypothetical protein
MKSVSRAHDVCREVAVERIKLRVLIHRPDGAIQGSWR